MSRLKKLAHVKHASSNVDEILEKVPDTKLGYMIKDTIKGIEPGNFIEYVEKVGKYSHADQILYDVNENFVYTVGMDAFKVLDLAEELYNTVKSQYQLEGSFDEEVKNYLNNKVDNLDDFANVNDLNDSILQLISDATELQDEMDSN